MQACLITLSKYTRAGIHITQGLKNKLLHQDLGLWGYNLYYLKDRSTFFFLKEVTSNGVDIFHVLSFVCEPEGFSHCICCLSLVLLNACMSISIIISASCSRLSS